MAEAKTSSNDHLNDKADVGKIRVAVVQMRCNDDGDREANMTTLNDLLEEGLGGDMDDETRPEIILGPEFAICGYTYDYETMWKAAEKQGGMTERFVCNVASRYKIFFGLSYLEVRAIDDRKNNDSSGGSFCDIGAISTSSTEDEGGDDNANHRNHNKDGGEPHFLNTFCLAGPDGTIRGRISKATPCSVESYFFRAPPPSPSPHHVIECDTTDGRRYRLGVLICYENFVYDSLSELQNGPQIDLLLQPFSGPLADDQNAHVKEVLRDMYRDVCSTNGRYLQCPTLYCNKVGKWKQPSPSRAMPMTFDTEFPGGCSIYDYKMDEVVGRLGPDEQGFLSREVTLGTAITPKPSSSINDNKIPRYLGGYTHPSPFLKVCVVYEWLGSKSYKNDKLRKKLATDAWERNE